LLVTGAISNLKSDSELWSVPLPVGSPRRIGDLVGEEADWSPDGSKLAYVNRQSIYLAGADGSEARKIATLSGSLSNLHFSPDGRRLRFTIFDATRNTAALWEIAVDGSNPHQLLLGWQNP